MHKKQMHQNALFGIYPLWVTRPFRTEGAWQISVLLRNRHKENIIVLNGEYIRFKRSWGFVSNKTCWVQMEKPPHLTVFPKRPWLTSSTASLLPRSISLKSLWMSSSTASISGCESSSEVSQPLELSQSDDSKELQSNKVMCRKKLRLFDPPPPLHPKKHILSLESICNW